MTTETKVKERREFSAQQKCQVVLSVWTKRRKPAQACRELSIHWAMLRHWQNRALEGMLESLEPRSRKLGEPIPALEPKLQQMLTQKALQREGKPSKLARRLSKIQAENQEAETPKPAA